MRVSRYSLAIIKPDAHRDILAESIIRDVKEAGLEIVRIKDMVLSRDQAEKIYSDHVGEYHFEASVKSLLGQNEERYVTLLIVKSEDQSSNELLHKIKGRADRDGIRLKYKLYTVDELKDRGYEGEELKNELAKNRMHVPDSDELCMEIMNILLADREIEDIRHREPDLFKEIAKSRGEHLELRGNLILR